MAQNIFGSESGPAVPGGNVAKPLIVAVLALLASRYFGGKKQEPAAVQARLRQLALRDKQARVMVKGDRDVAYVKVMEVMDMARQAGLTRIVLPTDPKLVP